MLHGIAAYNKTSGIHALIRRVETAVNMPEFWQNTSGSFCSKSEMTSTLITNIWRNYDFKHHTARRLC